MKTIQLILFSLFAVVCSVQAQVNEQIEASMKRAQRLNELMADVKQSGNDQVDGYGESLKKAAIFAIANSEKLENLYKRQVGETKDGVTDVTIEKPSLEDWVELSVQVAGEAAYIKEATDRAKTVAEEVKLSSEAVAKEKSPLKKVKEAKKIKAMQAVLEFGNKATPILLEESAAQVKAVNEIVETLKSGKNL